MQQRRAVFGMIAVGFLFLSQTGVDANRVQKSEKVRASSTLHNGWKLTPAGTHQKVGDMLLGCALSPDKSLFALTNAGYNAHHIYLLDAKTGALRQELKVAKTWNGIAWSKEGNRLYASGGGDPKVHTFDKGADGKFYPASAFVLPGLVPKREKGKEKKQALVSGLALSKDGKTLFVANFASDTIFALNLSNGTVIRQKILEENAHPYCLRLSPKGEELYITEGALGKIAILKTSDLTPIKSIRTEKHPNDMLFTPDGRLFVSCGNSDSVLAIDPKTGETRERIAVSLTPKSPAGTTPNALALSPDGKTLYVANSDNNDVAVIDVTKPNRSHVMGFIPTGWYPTLVCLAPNGKNLFIGSGKGMGTGPNSPKLFPPEAKGKRSYVYVGTLMYGLLSTLSIPTDQQLGTYTRQVMANTPYRDALIINPKGTPKRGTNPIPSRLGDPSPIKYVLYIIKENRTYDQVLGDLKDKNGKPRGNGDPDLTLFGEKVTPNLHELSRQFITLDNTYCNGDVSGNGHPWSTAAYGTDIGERSWMLSYSGRAAWALSDRDLFPPVGRIWDVCAKFGLSFASYYFTWTTPNTEQNMPEVWRKGFWDRRDTENADIFIRNLKEYERKNNLPRFIIMTLREDHTRGTTPNAFTPQACVASNDQGVGRIVDACSHSKYWKQMAIFVIEDDGQDGPDHVEAHRTTAYIISPYTRTGKVVSTNYNTVSMLRTMELILGLPPMSQYDAASTPMYNAFTNKPDFTPYTALPPGIDLLAKNRVTAYGAQDSAKMDFSIPDHLTAEQVASLNRILWHSIKGTSVPYPSINRRILYSPTGGVSRRLAQEDDD